jgi:glycosyltransferase involved in cell wall biosynthesis
LKLKILFICGSLERGQDGVGDYTRRLSGELIRMQHECFIVSLNDKYVFNSIIEVQKDLETPIQTHRLPQTLPWANRIKYLEGLVSEMTPNIISLQFVPFAYNKKGLPFGLGQYLKKSSGVTEWQIMFHELWVGRDSFKLNLLASLQKFLIRKMIQALNPGTIHTHLPAYLNKLEKLSVKVSELPLFSNFASGDNKAFNKNPKIFKLAFFNLVSDHPAVISFIHDLDIELNKKSLKLEIILIGGSVERLTAFKNQLINKYNFKNKIILPGFLEEAELSSVIESCDLGITTLPKAAIGKSGTSIAFLACGIPLAVPLAEGLEKPFFNSELNGALLFHANISAYQAARDAALRQKLSLNISYIAEKFISDLINNSNSINTSEKLI